MLTQVRIGGFRLLRWVEVETKPLTVLVGPNNSGKSSFLQAIHKTARNSFGKDDRRRANTPISLSFLAGLLTNPKSRWDVTCAEGTRTGSGNPEVPEILAQSVLIELPRTGAVMTGEAVPDSQGAPTLGGDGGQLAGLLDHLQRCDRPRFDRMVQAARKLVRGLSDLTLVALTSSTRSLRLTIEGGFTLDAESASSGVRTLLYFLGLAYHPRPPRLILVEEPECGLHPKMLGDVVSLFRSLTRGEFGAVPAQIILTTHSPYLLDHVKLGQDQVLVCRRGSDGEGLIEAADPERLKSFLDEFMLGEVWSNQGEDGLVRREPQATAAKPS